MREIHAAWDEAASAWPVACAPGCAVCCTDRVTATEPEAALLLDELTRLGRSDLAEALAGASADPAARPTVTPNQAAALCLVRQEPPDQPAPAAPAGRCPVLGPDGLCLAYAARPLACRVMLSARACEPGGAASPRGWWITLALALGQVTEQAAVGLGYGLLSDLAASRSQAWLTCQNLPGLPAPAEHQARLQDELGRIMARPVAGRPLGLVLRELAEG